MKTKTIIIVVAALAVGAAVGWFVGGFVKGRQHAGGVGVSPAQCDGQGVHRASKAPSPRRRAPIRSTSDADVQRRALEKRVRFLEDSIRIAKEKKPTKVLDATKASNDEIVERLMKLPTERERDMELQRLGKKRFNTFTIGQLGKLCPKMYGELSREEKEVYLGRVYEKSAERLAVLESVDKSLMTDDERALHQNFAEDLSHLLQLYNEKVYHLDVSIENKTAGEVIGDFQMIVDYQKRRASLLSEERDMLVSQAVKHFGIPDDAAADLLTAMSDVAEATDPTGFYRKK